jgi:8-oxo-dGTP pyrophosphatase MutT (NUDIX family)
MQSNLFFQYCQNLVILSSDKKSVLLAKRKGEADYDGTYSFVGGKMETTDTTLIAGMKREKDEEIGEKTAVKIIPNESYNILFRKKDGSSMIIPHVCGYFVLGDIKLSDEYSDYKWVAVEELNDFEPKIENITELTNWAIAKLNAVEDNNMIII